MHFRRLTALFMICAYLILPLDSFAGHRVTGAERSPAPLTLSALDHPCDAPLAGELSGPAGDSHCPCSEEHESGGCGSSCSCCSCCSYHAPFPGPLAWPAGAPERSCRLRDPFQFLPEVYLAIFVPPQNRA
ncbi:hypothetical protein GMST_26040 [Geomonas silvestris]|uniref:Uncharacterized protein n=1 Tax=Geomonas silvestris TaxID=2740184 RepID=A0A6V8MKW2_9BACT|nr:hypothetical protein [Geomonas silvestris]GFO60279.1 hypothetical protein GMST_26040 [Geomonas silvestris]